MVKYYKDQLSHLFYALADASRREILTLVSQAPCKASELARHFDISFPAVSKHIRILENAGFVKRQISGREHQIILQQKNLEKAYKWLAFHRRFWLQKLDNLEKYLKTSQPRQKRNKSREDRHE